MDLDHDLSSLLQTYDQPTDSPSDLLRLQTLWQAELASPEIFPYPGELLERILERVRQQLDLLEQLGAELQDAKTGFRSVVIQTELERVKWLVRVYVRTRIRKLDLHPPYTPAAFSKLSTSEVSYVRAHQKLLAGHYTSSFLREFPPQLRKLDDVAGDVSMLEEPDLDKAVVAKVREDIPGLVNVGGGERVRLQKDDVLLVRWRAIREECVGMGGAERIELI